MCPKGDFIRYFSADLIAAGDLDAAQPLVTDGVQTLPAVGGAVQLVQPCHRNAQGERHTLHHPHGGDALVGLSLIHI